MPGEGAPAGLAIHATGVAIGGGALLITGRSGSGKSRLAVALVAASTSASRIVLVGDDRVLLTSTARGVEVRPHPRTAGFIERRGLGLMAAPWRERVLVAGLAMLDADAAAPPLGLENLPVLRLVDIEEASRAEALLAWWPYRGKEATVAGHAHPRTRFDREDWNW